ncbi:MAG: T9SS type A sorting domain-containing protein [Bacteroidota bacterium]
MKILLHSLSLFPLVTYEQTEVEPNGSVSSATPINLGREASGFIQEALDEDYFSFNVTEPGIIYFSLLRQPAGVQLRIFLYDTRGQEIYDLLLGTADPNNFKISVCESGEYILQYEDSPATPDQDYYSINLEAGISYRVVTYDIPENLRLETTLFAPGGGEVESEFGTATNLTNFFYEAAETGTYSIRVRDRNNRFNAELPYTLQVGCNLTTTTAEVISLTAGVVYPYPVEDYLTLDPRELTASHSLLIEILDTYGRTVLRKRTTNQLSAMDLSRVPAGTYYLGVFDTGIQYTSHQVRK